jgi:hypothetical protein
MMECTKGLLRFPEVNRSGNDNVHELTEYLLVGTFTSILIGGILALLVLADSADAKMIGRPG